MRISFIINLFICISLYSFGQEKLEISEMKWGADFNIHITFSNDSTSIHDIKGLYHTNQNLGTSTEVTYYPVTLDNTFIQTLKNKKFDAQTATNQQQNSMPKTSTKTLWSALHNDLGGGYIHFINCLIYAFESENLNLTAPLMIRPTTDWKPNPVTETYLRTKKWTCFAPENQKLAIKEYKIQKKKNELGDINLLPYKFIELFTQTSDKEYIKLAENNQSHDLAIIDMIRLLLGSKYLGQDQINYIQNAVRKSVMHYNINNLPSVIIFDNYDAAVAMTLDKEGYKIEKVVINNQESLSAEEQNAQLKKMEAVIHEINEVNKKVFENKLKGYYKE